MAERGLSTTSTHSQAPEIPLGPDPSPTRAVGAPAEGAEASGPRTPSSPFEANVAAVNQADQASLLEMRTPGAHCLPILRASAICAVTMNDCAIALHLEFYCGECRCGYYGAVLDVRSSAVYSEQGEAAKAVPGSGRPLGRAGSNMSAMSSVSGVEAGGPTSKRKGSIEHEGGPLPDHSCMMHLKMMHIT